jgi:hypothetical protein
MEQGRKSFVNGAELSENPYPPRSRNRALWVEGFMLAWETNFNRQGVL